MSYLGFPRLTFAGAFQADVSTVNNDPEHFDDDRFQPRFQDPGVGTTNGWWNPTGSGAFRFRDCVIGQALGPRGELGSDVVVGGRLRSRDDRAPAKLVDLDPEQQMVSTIFGLGLRLEAADGSLVFAGEFETAPFSDIWVRYPQGRPDSFFSAIYQSVITDVTWGDGADRSPVASALRAASASGVLSIKFTVDGMDDTLMSPTFTWGRVVGAIGAHLPGEPHHFVPGRLLTAPPGSPLNTAPARVDDATQTLLLDFGNSLPTVRPGGPLKELGVLRVGVVKDNTPTPVASVNSSSAGLNDIAAGILSIPLSEEQATLLAGHPLVVHDDAGNLLLSEDRFGRFVRPDAFVFRLDPGADGAGVSLRAFRYGVPEPNVKITLALDEASEQAQVKQGPLPGPPVGVPAGALMFPESVVTGPDGVASATLTGKDPGNPRGYIDGQVYSVAVGWDGDPGPSNGYELSVLLFDAYQVPDTPTWVGHVKPILQQYANLYPVMKGIVDLADYHSVVSRREMLELSMSLPITDPNLMPVTRDLSAGKRATILKWLADPGHPHIGDSPDIATVRTLVQTAIEIEHATIPAYLYALLSIKPGRNTEIAGLIRGIVIQEMLHMVLACNLLNAIGGEPVLDKPGFVPRYPGHLPGDVRPDLEVSLRPLSISQVRDVFMAIELPEETIGLKGAAAPPPDVTGISVDADGYAHGPHLAAAEAVRAMISSVEYHRWTIGWYYQSIAKALVELDANGPLFTGNPGRQVTPRAWPAAPGLLYRVHNLNSALLAICEIVRQGEGTPLRSPLDAEGELAHYFRFSEIVEGRSYIQTETGEWVYAGAPIPFDPGGVWPVVADPSLVPYPLPSAARAAGEFDAAYRGLLDLLHQVVNGAPEKLGAAVGVMFSLEVQAQKLVQIPIAPDSDSTAGPRFQVG